MTATDPLLNGVIGNEYRHGFVTELENDSLPRGLTDKTVRMISARKNESAFMLEWRLKAFHHWLTLKKPNWSTVKYPAIDYQDIIYFSAPKSMKDGPQSLADVDPELLRTYEKLGVPLHERERLAGVAVDAVFDSVSVGTTYKDKLAELGIIFGSFSDAVREHPDLVQQYLGSVVPYSDNFFAALNAAVFSDGSFCYIPPGRTVDRPNNHDSIGAGLPKSFRFAGKLFPSPLSGFFHELSFARYRTLRRTDSQVRHPRSALHLLPDR